MNIFVDENIPIQTARELRELGHNITDIRGTEKEGMTDDDIWGIVQKEQKLLITTDKGFALKRHEKHGGILIVKLKKPNRLKIHQKIMKAMSHFKEKDWTGMTVIMQDFVHSTWKSKKQGN